MSTKKKIILSLILLSYFIVGMDGSIIFTGVVKIAEDLHLNYTELSWVQNAYLIAFGGFMLMSGGLGEAYGRKRMFNLSLALFGLGSLGAGVAQTAGFMIGSRFVQGIGAAMLAPTSLALIIDYFDGKERVKAVAWYGSMSGIGLCIGLILGGAITSYASWRIGFLVNIPICATMTVLSLRTLDDKAVERQRFDTVGTILSIAGIFCLLYAIDGAQQMAGWIVAGVILLLAFIVTERRNATPIMPLSLFADTDRCKAYLVRALILGAMMGFNFFVSEFMQKAFGFTPLEAGYAFLPMNLSTFVAALRIPSLVSRYGDKRVLLAGLLSFLTGFGCLLTLVPDSSYLTGISLPMLFIGLGVGLTLSPLTNIGIKGVTHDETGAASALVNVAHQVGGAFGLLLMIRSSDGLGEASARFHAGILISFGCMVGALLLSLTIGHASRGKRLTAMFNSRLPYHPGDKGESLG